jgi:hypothetical protein
MKLGKALTLLSTPAGAGVPLFLVAACSSSSHGVPPVDTNAETAALDAPNGKIDLTSKEAPAFGDPEVIALPVMAEPAGASISPASHANSSAAPGTAAYRLAFIWGHLPLAHDATGADVAPESAQWTGTISVDTGTLRVLRTIAFGSNDSISAPNASADPRAVAFRAQTSAYVDGVLVQVLVPPGAALTVHFVTNQVSTDVDLRTLQERAGGIERAPDGSSGIGWFGFREDLCVRGFILGRWVKDAPAIGRTLAAVSDADGALLGYVRGLWGYAPGRSGEVWFDKYIDVAGNPRGLVFGWYGGGFFRGVWGATGEHDVSALDVGTAEGLYSDGDEAGDGRSVWLGRWSAPCVP